MLVFKRKEEYNCYSVWFGGIEVGSIYKTRWQFKVRCFDKNVYCHLFDANDTQKAIRKEIKKIKK